MGAATVDFDLHGLVGLRLVEPGDRDVAAVRRQTGLEPVTLDRPPDLVLRFTERLDMGHPVRLLGLDDAAYTDERFLVVRDPGRRPTYLEVPFDEAGPGWTLTCERGRARIPLLVALLNLVALGNDVLPLHGSVFELDGTGVLVVGWAKGGKTETLLGFMEQGAVHVGDEWVYLPHGGREVYGIPEPMRVWDWHLEDLPALRARLPRKDRVRLRAVAGAATTLSGLSHAPGAMGSVLRRAAHVVGRQRFVHARPEELFGSAACTFRGRIDLVLLVVSHDSPETVSREVDPSLVAQRMAASLRFERAGLLAAYEQFRFAFPSRRSTLLEGAAQREGSLLAGSLAGCPAYELAHPYPADIPALVQAGRRAIS